MKQRRLGAAGPLTSSLGLGCMGMSEFYGETNDADSLQTLEKALALGITYFDTADTYGLGHNESLLGRFIAQGGSARRQQMVIATKFGIVRATGQYERRIDNSPTYIREACEASLRRLGVDRIDLYYCHRRDPAVPIEEVVGVMGDLVTSGKVGAIGLSEVSVESLRRAHAVAPIAAVQSEYSMWSRDPEAGTLAACAELGTAFVAYSPLGRAFLTGTLDVSQLADNDFRKHNPRFVGEAQAANQRLVASLAAFAAERHLSNAQVALAWMLNKHPHVIPIPGTRRIAHLESNVSAADIVLTPGEIAQLDLLFDPKVVAGARYPDAGLVGMETR
ncbi:MAG: aldo/keto reductase [Betaproteobacteria bacterium HGW-Betaproteobacteria-16]|nr:MAG: aldo/keto reductase [Betaproteobacteria bacterium HGW-Betaproteobacteria-16]